MKALCAGLVVGSLCLLVWPEIPSLQWLWALALSPCLLLLHQRFLFGVLVASALCLWAVHSYQEHREALLGQGESWHSGKIQRIVAAPLQDSAQVTSEVEPPWHASTWQFKNSQSNTGTFNQQQESASAYTSTVFRLSDLPYRGFLVQLGWQNAPHFLGEGQRWQLKLRCKKVQRPANPGQASAERNAYVNGVLAQCQVRQAFLLDARVSERQSIYSRWQERLGQMPTFSLISALTLGERPFSAEIWLGLQASALGHLISISGFHIGLLFGWVLFLARALSRLEPFSWLKKASPWLALFAAAFYSLLAGLAIPTIRALVALVLAVFLLCLKRRLSYSQAWWLVLAGLLVLNPLWVLSVSFWLTVIAVGFLLLYHWRYPPKQNGLKGKLLWALGFQTWMTLLMVGPTLLFFQGVAPLAIVSNWLFVPWCSLLVIPWLFASVFLEWLWAWFGWPEFMWPWMVADWLLRPLLWWLEKAATSGLWWSLPSQNSVTALALSLSLTCLVFGIGRREKLLFCSVLLLPSMLSSRSDALWKLHLIDVGQGTSVLFQQGAKGLLYDVGPKHGRFSAAKSYVLPYVRYQGIQALDYVLLSHADTDHSGDYAVLLRAYPNATLLANFETPEPKLPCRALPKRWRALELETFFPKIQGAELGSNDSSCWLKLSGAGWQVLLTGDASKKIERLYLASNERILRTKNSETEGSKGQGTIFKGLLSEWPIRAAQKVEESQRFDAANTKVSTPLAKHSQVDVLLLGHHGSNSSSDLGFLQALRPSLALNSSGANNSYNHPHPDVLARLSLLKIPLFDTATHGAIELRFSIKGLEVWPYRQRLWPLWLRSSGLTAETVH